MSDAPETKSYGQDSHAAYGDLARAFTAFREANDERLHDIERRMTSDVVLEDKVARIDRAMDLAQRRIDDIALKSRRPGPGGALAGRDANEPALAEHKGAFDLYVRSGESGGLRAIEAKAMSVGSGPDGGYLAPPPAEREILNRLALVSPIRGIASVRAISTGQLKKAVATVGAAAGWVGETATRPQTNSPTLAELTFPAMELYAMPAATQTLLDDAVVDIDQWLADEVETSFAEQEGLAFVSGDGVNKPRGFLSYTKVANTAWTWDTIGYVPTGTAGAFPAANPSDVLVNLIYAVKASYRQNGSFVMNRNLQSQVRKFKDSTGAYLWQPPASLGQPATLMGFPVVEAEDMPNAAADSFAAAFGDFRRGYLVVDKMGVRVLRDPYSAKPYVLFYVTKRVGGGVQDFDAIKLLKFAVS